MKLLPLLSGYPILSQSHNLPHHILGFSSDSRKIKPGYLFVCVRGESADGHRFIDDAKAKGAVVIACEENVKGDLPKVIVSDTRHFLSFLSSRFYHEPSKLLKVTGITGTNGKTTTAHYLYEIYRSAGYKSALMGTVGVKKEGEYHTQSLTTPGPEELQKTLWQLVRERYDQVAMEVSSHALVQKRVEHCHFHTAIFTNLTREHLDYHKTMEDYFSAKAHLFTLLDNNLGTAVINADDPYSKKLRRLISGRVIGFGIKEPADIQAQNIYTLTDGGSYVKAASPWGEFVFILPMPGLHNVYNALAAAAAALADNITPADTICGLEALQYVPGRLERLPSPAGISVYLDYAHTPDGLKNVLMAVSEFPHHRIILVFGCRGRRDIGKRPEMGTIAEQYADLIVLTSDNPADEDPEKISCEISRHMSKKPVFIADRQSAIYYALSAACCGDIVLITGKGREDYQLIGEYTLPYSDFDTVTSYYQNENH